MTATKDQIVATIQTVKVVADTIRDLGSVPSGVLYANVMAHMSFEIYERIIQVLKNCGLVEESGHVLTWTGPKLEETK
jgi:hypothetical protein